MTDERNFEAACTAAMRIIEKALREARTDPDLITYAISCGKYEADPERKRHSEDCMIRNFLLEELEVQTVPILFTEEESATRVQRMNDLLAEQRKRAA